MSKLVPWEDLKPGMTVYEDYIGGTGTMKAMIEDFVDHNHLRIRYDRWSQITRRSPEFRYWDSKPTIEERQEAEWK